MKFLIVLACCVIVALADTTNSGADEPEWAKQVKTIREECRSENNSTEPKFNYRFNHHKKYYHHDHEEKMDYITCVLKRLDMLRENNEINIDNIKKHLTEILQEDIKRKVDYIVGHCNSEGSMDEQKVLSLWHYLKKHWKKFEYMRYYRHDGVDSKDESDSHQSHQHRHH